MYRVTRFLDDLLDRLLVLALLFLLLIGVYFIYDTAYVYYNASASRVVFQRPGAAAESEEETASKSLTEDYVAWLSLDDSAVDYPVMQGSDNNRYLSTNPYGEYSLSGSIFLDCRNARDFSDGYSVLYGHHMSGDFMFGALDRFYDKAYFDSHRTGTLIVGDTEYPLQIFAMLAVDAGEPAIFQLHGSEQVLEFAKGASLYYREPISEHILALSTCVDAASSGRTVLLCAMGQTNTKGEIEE